MSYDLTTVPFGLVVGVVEFCLEICKEPELGSGIDVLNQTGELLGSGRKGHEEPHKG
ncbi:MAG: hypothetical protein ACPG8N_02240 [Rhodothermales bacterium]